MYGCMHVCMHVLLMPLAGPAKLGLAPGQLQQARQQTEAHTFRNIRPTAGLWQMSKAYVSLQLNLYPRPMNIRIYIYTYTYIYIYTCEYIYIYMSAVLNSLFPKWPPSREKILSGNFRGTIAAHDCDYKLI